MVFGFKVFTSTGKRAESPRSKTFDELKENVYVHEFRLLKTDDDSELRRTQHLRMNNSEGRDDWIILTLLV
ncbi:MAG: hypothetical protein AOA65_0904 [Candidatus Bathyarchaeota archaeon BA1]|nr:MAG: hypothetical protein AOA65_0904 [Candidatus Bathyarchaeota archaeon BA1]